MPPEQFVDNGFVSRPNDRVWPTVSSKTLSLGSPFTLMPPSPLTQGLLAIFRKGYYGSAEGLQMALS